MRSVDPATQQIAMGVGLNTVAAVDGAVDSMGEFALAVAQSNSTGWYKFLYLMTIPMPIILGIISFKINLSFHQGMFLTFIGGMLGWPLFIGICEWFGKRMDRNQRLFELRRDLDEFNDKHKTNFGIDHESKYYDKDKPEACRIHIDEDDAFNLFTGFQFIEDSSCSVEVSNQAAKTDESTESYCI